MSGWSVNPESFPEPLTREKLMSGKILVCWKHDLTSEVARRRYLQSQDTLRSTHGEIANLFFSEFSQQGSDADTEEAGEITCLTYTKWLHTSFLCYFFYSVTFLSANVSIMILAVVFACLWNFATNFKKENIAEGVRFEVFTPVTMKNCVFWDVTPCGSCKNRRFGGT
jgi:hypothetical protein